MKEPTRGAVLAVLAVLASGLALGLLTAAPAASADPSADPTETPTTSTAPSSPGTSGATPTTSAVPTTSREPTGAEPAGPPEPVTVTLSPEQVAHLCEKRLPKIERRVTRLLDRINGGPDRRGSVEWLRARAATERDAGRENKAQALEAKADRRAGRVDELNKIRQWVADFRAEHCEAT